MMYQTVITKDYHWSEEIVNRHDEEVERLISYGWKPMGGVSCSINNTCVVLAQAMVKGG